MHSQRSGSPATLFAEPLGGDPRGVLVKEEGKRCCDESVSFRSMPTYRLNEWFGSSLTDHDCLWKKERGRKRWVTKDSVEQGSGRKKEENFLPAEGLLYLVKTWK